MDILETWAFQSLYFGSLMFKIKSIIWVEEHDLPQLNRMDTANLQSLHFFHLVTIELSIDMQHDTKSSNDP